MARKIKQNKVGRPSKAQTMLQTREVAAMLLMAKPRSEIMQHCQDNYGLQETSVAAVITRAYQYLAETHQIDREATVILHLQYYYDLYAQAKTLGDTRGAVQCLNSIEKLLKLTNDVLVQNNNLTVNLKDLTLTELKELLQLKSA
jgi:hypothetical protein